MHKKFNSVLKHYNNYREFNIVNYTTIIISMIVHNSNISWKLNFNHDNKNSDWTGHLEFNLELHY